MWVKVITPFFGTEEKRLQRTGDVIQVSEDRGEKMVARELVVTASEPTKPKPRSRRRSRKEAPPEDKVVKPSKDKDGEPTETREEKPGEDKAEKPKEDKAGGEEEE